MTPCILVVFKQVKNPVRVTFEKFVSHWQLSVANFQIFNHGRDP